MDYQSFVDNIEIAACVLSVQKNPDGTCGEIHILWANEMYKNEMKGYIPGMIYSDLVPKDNKFEDYCYNAAFNKKRMHAYVHAIALGGWIDQFILPLKSDRDDIGYCFFQFEFTKEAEAERRAGVNVKVANDVVRACIKMKSHENFIASMQACVRDIRLLCSADSCCILYVNWDLDESRLLAYDMSEDAKTDVPNPQVQSSAFHNIVKTWPETIGVSDCLIVKNKNELKELKKHNPEWGDSLEKTHVSSLVIYPLYFFDDNVGYIWVTNFDKDKTVEIKETLELTAFFLGAEISNYNLMNKLKYMGLRDQLTGLKNRHAMEEYLHSLSEDHKPQSLGIMYADINGLKLANDTLGHKEGDRLIISAANLLREVFCHPEIFRVGGDEFVVFTEDLDEVSYNMLFEQLKKLSVTRGSVSLAIGSFYSKEISNITQSMRIAEERMYADKKNFYLVHPDMSRRQ